ncbi:MAG: ShlB/FhaC/HecB family hemolysin secretion/activation protein [Prochlorotrichaceae cyanobacterium]|jgi:hemolysin activation/secretion protein
MVWCENKKNNHKQSVPQNLKHFRNGVAVLLLGGSLLNVADFAQAQPVPSNAPDPSDIRQGNPNEEQFPQSVPAPNQFENLPGLDSTPEAGEGLPDAGTGASVFISRILVEGSTVYDSDRLQEAVSGFEGRELTLEELQSAADAVTQIYLNDGYITTRAVLVDQEIVDGVVTIQIIEGTLADIQIEGTERLRPKYISSRIRLGAKTPLRVSELEDQLRLLRVDPLLASLEASLRASDKVGQSVLAVRVTEAPNWGGFVGIDNYSPESVGGQRSRAEMYYRNLAGNGETLIGGWDRSFVGGSDVFRVTYRQPVNARNGTVQLQTTIDRNEITLPPFDALDIAGETESYEISFRQPIIRSPRRELGLSVAYRYQNGQTFVGGVGSQLGTTTGAEPDGTTRVGVFKFGQDFVRRDPKGAWALQSQFSFGTDFPFDGTTNSGDIPDTHFFSWLGQAQRVQRINDRNLLILQADLQLATAPLLSSQQFVLGGGQSVRGYSQNLRSGDNGFRFSAENRFTVGRNDLGRTVLQLAPFFDTGVVWKNENNPNPVADGTFLAGAGLGILWQPTPKLDIRFDWGVPIVSVNDDVKDEFQDHGLYFNVNYRYP